MCKDISVKHSCGCMTFSRETCIVAAVAPTRFLRCVAFEEGAPFDQACPKCRDKSGDTASASSTTKAHTNAGLARRLGCDFRNLLSRKKHETKPRQKAEISISPSLPNWRPSMWAPHSPNSIVPHRSTDPLVEVRLLRADSIEFSLNHCEDQRAVLPSKS